jgi:hypothetical protein
MASTENMNAMPLLMRMSVQMFLGKPQGKRPLGTTSRRWEVNVKVDLRKSGYEIMD